MDPLSEDNLLLGLWGQLPPLWQHWVLVGGAVVGVLNYFVLPLTPTPDPNTTLGKVYALVEKICGVWGKAKQNGAQAPNGALPPETKH